ncbi:MAG: 30S ribosomal protein S6 [Okeania sp. SIO3I5]|uniref:30S ribosomal protein S6 n=1 Tax=Okeania sp. SIO3I5 TaxID=2607805 RepID=UPI0013BC3081|nr:30S ribosomal protein S6 [Okeania sp. SIO3I5]NEQ39016.1 30S ribosomal protein S6 [Okeania sp. SIO3I5]
MKPFIYETMYILRPDLTEEQVEQEITKYKDILQEQGAYDLQIQHRGKRRLAYEINDRREGTYIQMNYQGPPAQIAVLERAMRLSEEVIRYLTIKQEVPKTTNTDTQSQPEPVVASVQQ